jgi:hypothetical protein
MISVTAVGVSIRTRFVVTSVSTRFRAATIAVARFIASTSTWVCSERERSSRDARSVCYNLCGTLCRIGTGLCGTLCRIGTGQLGRAAPRAGLPLIHWVFENMAGAGGFTDKFL